MEPWNTSKPESMALNNGTHTFKYAFKTPSTLSLPSSFLARNNGTLQYSILLLFTRYPSNVNEIFAIKYESCIAVKYCFELLLLFYQNY